MATITAIPERRAEIEERDWARPATEEVEGSWRRPGWRTEERLFLYDGVAAGREVRASLARRSAASRPLPLEEVCFFVKPIDNSRLVKVMDPHSKWEILKMLGAGLFVFLLAFGYILPYLGILNSGYRMEDLKREHEELIERSRQLQVKEAGLRDLRRVDEVARTELGMTRPTRDQVVYADGAAPPENPIDLVAQNLSRFAVERR